MTDAALLRKHGWISVRFGDAQHWHHEKHGTLNWTEAMAKLAHDLDSALEQRSDRG